MCVYPSSNYTLTHDKYFMRWCENFPRMDLPGPESDQHNSNFTPTIQFHVYQHIARCNLHGRRPFNDNKPCKWCETSIDSIVTSKFTPWKIMSWWSHQLWIFINNYTFLKSRNLHLTYHMYVFLEHITVETLTSRHSRVIQILNMCCSTMIIQNV